MQKHDNQIIIQLYNNIPWQNINAMVITIVMTSGMLDSHIGHFLQHSKTRKWAFGVITSSSELSMTTSICYVVKMISSITQPHQYLLMSSMLDSLQWDCSKKFNIHFIQCKHFLALVAFIKTKDIQVCNTHDLGNYLSYCDLLGGNLNQQLSTNEDQTNYPFFRMKLSILARGLLEATLRWLVNRD